MASDVRAGKCTLEDLKALKHESLAASYGVKSRSTAVKALQLAADDLDSDQ